MLDGAGLDWVGLGRIELDWAFAASLLLLRFGLGRFEFGWTGLDWDGLDSVGQDWT